MRWLRQPMTRVAVVLIGAWAALAAQGGCSSSMSATESAARDALREMGAIPGWDAKNVHVATLMLTAPQVAKRMDEAMPHVANLPYLTHLELTNTNLNDEHMKTVGSLKRLTSLVLSGTQVGDEGFKHVADRRLDALYVDGTQITSASLERIGQMPSMTILDISSLDVTSDLSPLASLDNLEWLVIENATLDSNAVDVIKDLESLGRLTIKGSTISADDLARLKSAKPALAIDQTEPATAADASANAGDSTTTQE